MVVCVQNNRARIHYIGGDEDEDEWIPKSSDRLRPPQDEKKIETVDPPPIILTNSDHGSADDYCSSLDQRPLRRSRLLSDDAKLALALQEQEVKAAREKISTSRKRNKAPVSREVKPSKHGTHDGKPTDAVFNPIPDGNQEVSSGSLCEPFSPFSAVTSAESRISLNVTPSSARRSSIVNAPPGKKLRQGSKPASVEEQSGTVAFLLLPDEKSSDPVPALRHSRMCLVEDVTVSQVKRLLVEALPGISAADVVMRTPCGMLVGQDHSLRYVRNFLWPRSKGELVLRYSLSKGLLF